MMNLANQFNDASIAKDELQKACEECRDIPLEQRAVIENFLKIESELDYEMNRDLLWNGEKLGKQIRDKKHWINMLFNPKQVRLTVLTKLQEALDEVAILEEQILALMHRFADRFIDRRVEINNLIVLHDHLLIDYSKYALGCMTRADMKKCVYLKSVRDELLRSMEEKRQMMMNYRDM
nr:hypothetical protein [Tanacetum cinerariifolium]